MLCQAKRQKPITITLQADKENATVVINTGCDQNDQDF